MKLSKNCPQKFSSPRDDVRSFILFYIGIDAHILWVVNMSPYTTTYSATDFSLADLWVSSGQLAPRRPKG